jgi:hypothetical protein
LIHCARALYCLSLCGKHILCTHTHAQARAVLAELRRSAGALLTHAVGSHVVLKVCVVCVYVLFSSHQYTPSTQLIDCMRAEWRLELIALLARPDEDVLFVASNTQVCMCVCCVHRCGGGAHTAH